MAVLISNGATSLATASGFYRVEAHNLGLFSGTRLSLSSTRTIPVTFANAGSCQGVVLALYTSGVYANLRSVLVRLQENVASVWTTRASVTLTPAQIATDGSYLAGQAYGVYLTPCVFSAPYAVTTSASIWRFEISWTGTGSTNWELLTSDGTNAFFATWCNNSLSWTSGDVLICKEVVTIDTTTTMGAAALTGDSTRGVSCVICTGSGTSADTRGLLQWGSGNYTLTTSGIVLAGRNGGICFGTSSNRISGTWNIPNPSFGSSTTQTNRGLQHAYSNTANSAQYGIFQIYATQQTERAIELAADTSTSSAVATLASAPTTWSNGDRIYIGKQDVMSSSGDTTIRTISSVAGTTLTASSNWITNIRKASTTLHPNYVYNLEKTGFKINSTGSARPLFTIPCPSVFITDSVGFYDVHFVLGAAGVYTIFPSSVDQKLQFVDCLAVNVGAIANALNFLSSWGIWNNRPGAEVLGSYFIKWGIANMSNVPSFGYAGFSAGLLDFQNNHIIGAYSMGMQSTCKSQKWINNIFQNCQDFRYANYCTIWLAGGEVVFQQNKFWGGTVCLLLSTIINPTWSGNAFDRSTTAIMQAPNAVSRVICVGDSFGTESLNSVDVGTHMEGLPDIELSAPLSPADLIIGNNGYSSSGDFPSWPTTTNSRIKVSNSGGVANRDFCRDSNGWFYRTGDGLADTTVRTAGSGKFALRFEPNNTPNNLLWSFSVPCGNIQNKTMTISVWAKINAANYYAGTHVKPTLSVNFDNGTISTAVATASTGWQRLAVTFTPTTTYGQLTISVYGCSDAASASDRYFYVDDFNVAYPAGVQLDLGGMDLWANAFPITPPIATNITAADVWAASTNQIDIPSTAGGTLININDYTVDTNDKVIDLQAAVSALNNISVSDIMGYVVESNGSITQEQAMRGIIAVLFGATANKRLTFKTPDGTTTRVAANIDAGQERANITLNL